MSRGSWSIAFLLTAILLERFALPLGGKMQLPLVVPLGMAILAFGLRAGEFRVRASQVRVLVVVLATAFACTLVFVLSGAMPSLLSVGLIVALYAGLALRADLSATALARVERVFLAVMSFFAAVSLVQLVIQYLGIPYQDYLLLVVPENLLLIDYNTADPIAYGDPLYRSNAVLFLEPSFLSLFLGLAASLALHRGASVLQVTLLLCGMIPTLAGTGFVVLAAGVVTLLFSRRRRRLLAALPAVTMAVVVAVLTPLGERYLDRSTEASDPRTSSSIRLVQPYTELLPAGVQDGTLTATFGHGAGSADDFLKAEGVGGITQPLLPKVLYEYGLLGVAGILISLVSYFAKGVRQRPWALGLLLIYLYVNASFLQSTMVFVTVFWLSLMPPIEAVVQRSRRAPAAGADHQSLR